VKAGKYTDNYATHWPCVRGLWLVEGSELEITQISAAPMDDIYLYLTA